MPIHFSTDLINALLGGNSDLRDLEKYYQRYMTGDKTALMSILITCAALQAFIPDWAVDELLSLDERIESGEVSDLNEFFGFKAEHKATIKKRLIKKESYSKVHMALISHRLIGGNFSTSGEVVDGLRVVADCTNTPVRIVQD